MLGDYVILKSESLVYWLKNKHIDIAFLQETYFNDKFCSKLDREWGNNTSFHNLSDSRHSRGISILLSKNIKVDEISCKMWKFGRKILLNLKFNDVLYTLATMYVPNNIDDRVQFLNSSCKWIKENADSEDRLIVPGDMNCTLTELDRPSGNSIKVVNV